MNHGKAYDSKKNQNVITNSGHKTDDQVDEQQLFTPNYTASLKNYQNKNKNKSKYTEILKF